MNYVDFGNGLFMIGFDRSTACLVSGDGATWTVAKDDTTENTDNYRGHAVYGGGKWVRCAGYNGDFEISTDNGATWTLATSRPPIPEYFQFIFYAGGSFLAASSGPGSTSLLAKSADGDVWENVASVGVDNARWMGGCHAADGRLILISKINGTFVYTDNADNPVEPPPIVPDPDGDTDGGGTIEGTASSLYFQGAAILTERTLNPLVTALNRSTVSINEKMPLDISSLPDPTE